MCFLQGTTDCTNTLSAGDIQRVIGKKIYRVVNRDWLLVSSSVKIMGHRMKVVGARLRRKCSISGYLVPALPQAVCKTQLVRGLESVLGSVLVFSFRNPLLATVKAKIMG